MAENENKNIILTDMEVTETNELVQIDETIQVIEFDDVNAYEIQTDNAFAALGEPNAQLRHSLLTNREDPNQHPIIAIEGLREELDAIEALQTVYSDKKQQADYYMWHDENLAGDNRVGYFVSMYKATEHDAFHGTLCCIEICDSTQDVFGVTVSEAGFIGGQEYAQATDGTKVGRNHKYGLVVHSGLVAVQCESNVEVGDYVASNSRGVAAKTNGKHGYLVTTMSDIDGIMHAIISLTPSSVIAQEVADDLQGLGERMISAEYNIASVTNVANSAYALAIDAKENAEVNSEYLEEKITEVLSRMDAVDSAVGTLGESVNNASTEAAMARVIADGAVSSAEAIKDEAVKSANEANKNVNDLIKKYEPLDEWVDPITGQISKSYIIDDLDNNGLATKSEIKTVEDKTEKNYTAIQQNAKSIQSLASKIDKYAMGEYSQAYGLTFEQAKTILPIGVVYVPTLNHEETYDTYTQEFLKGYYYTWSGESWDASESVSVAFSNVYMAGTEGFYWVVTDQDVEVKNAEGEVTATYDLGGLYLYRDSAWVKVASVADNTMSRAISAIRQTADGISIEIVDIKGDVASSKQWIDDNSTNIQSVVTWKNDVESDVASIATIKQTADDAGASIAQVVEAVGSNGEVNAASITTAIVGDTSSIGLLADNITLDGYVKFTNLSTSGETTIDGANIKTGTIDVDRINVQDIIATGSIAVKSEIPTDDKITKITNTTIETTDVLATNLRVNAANISDLTADKIDVPDLSAFQATIGGWDIRENRIYKGDVLLNSGNDTTYQSLVTDGNSPVRFSAGGDTEIPKYVTLTQDVMLSDGSGQFTGQHTEVTIDCDHEVLSVKIVQAYLEDETGGTYDLSPDEYSIQNVNLLGKTFDLYLPQYDNYDLTYDSLWVVYRYQYRKIASTQSYPAFKVLEDGSLYASNVHLYGKMIATDGEFAGTVCAESGEIGGLQIDNGIKGKNDYGDDVLSLTSEGLVINKSTATLRIGDLEAYYNSNMKRTYLQANGPLLIRGTQQNTTSAAIELMNDPSTTTVNSTITLHVLKTQDEDNHKTVELTGVLKTTAQLYYPATYTIYYCTGQKSTIDSAQIRSLSLVIQPNSDCSEQRWFRDSGWTFLLGPTYIKFGLTAEECKNATAIQMSDYSDTEWTQVLEVDTLSQTLAKNNILITGHLVPTINAPENGGAGYNLGDSNRHWNTVYARTSEIGLSDKNKKNAINSLTDAHTQIFDALKPVSYKFNVNNNNRTHTGLIAQDVKEAVENAGLTTQDFAGYCEWENDDGSIGCGLRYGEFIALCINEIQKLKKRVAELEEEKDK